MEYISTREAATEWGVSLRYVQRLLHENRIAGVKKQSGIWLIPSDAKKPMDPRKEEKKTESVSSKYHYIPFIPLLKKNPDIPIGSFPEEYQDLWTADLAYRRGDFAPAIACWKNTKVSDETKLTAACLGITAAMSSGDYECYEEIQQYANNCMEQTDNPYDKALMSLPGVLAAVCFVLPSMVPDWLIEEDFSMFPSEIGPFLIYLYSMHLRNIGDNRGVIATAKTQILLCAQTNTFTWLDLNNYLLCALASFKLNDIEHTKEYLLSAMNLGLPHGMITPFADGFSLFGSLLESLVDEYYPQYQAPILALWSRSFPTTMYLWLISLTTSKELSILLLKLLECR